MRTIKEVIRSLSEADRKAIFSAFDSLEPFVLRLPENEFIAVHSQPAPGMVVETVDGFFSIGRIEQ